MFSTCRNTAIGAAALTLAVGFAMPAQAAFTFTMEQVGNDVVVDGSGSINTTDVTLIPANAVAGVEADFGILIGGPLGFNSVNAFQSFSGPTNFGPGGSFVTFVPTTASGDEVGIDPTIPDIFVPSGYVSGHSLSDTMTFTGETFATLGVIPGTYTWNFGTGANADSLILEIGVPEPASLTLLAVGLAGLGMALRLRRA